MEVPYDVKTVLVLWQLTVIPSLNRLPCKVNDLSGRCWRHARIAVGLGQDWGAPPHPLAYSKSYS